MTRASTTHSSRALRQMVLKSNSQGYPLACVSAPTPDGHTNVYANMLSLSRPGYSVSFSIRHLILPREFDHPTILSVRCPNMDKLLIHLLSHYRVDTYLPSFPTPTPTAVLSSFWSAEKTWGSHVWARGSQRQIEFWFQGQPGINR